MPHTQSATSNFHGDDYSDSDSSQGNPPSPMNISPTQGHTTNQPSPRYTPEPNEGGWNPNDFLNISPSPKISARGIDTQPNALIHQPPLTQATQPPSDPGQERQVGEQTHQSAPSPSTSTSRPIDLTKDKADSHSLEPLLAALEQVQVGNKLTLATFENTGNQATAPAQPIPASKPTAPAKPAARAQTTAPAKTAARAQTTAPAKTAATANPAAPAKSATVNPTAPAKSTAPAKPAAPAQTTAPAKPAATANPAAPAKSAPPAKSTAPATPAAPANPAAPAKDTANQPAAVMRGSIAENQPEFNFDLGDLANIPSTSSSGGKPTSPPLQDENFGIDPMLTASSSINNHPLPASSPSLDPPSQPNAKHVGAERRSSSSGATKKQTSNRVPEKRKRKAAAGGRAVKRRRYGFHTSTCITDALPGNPGEDFLHSLENMDKLTSETASSSQDDDEAQGKGSAKMFCQYCSDGGSFVVCSEPGCGVMLCVSSDSTACVQWDVPEGTPWYCLRHCRLKKILPKYTINSRIKSFFHGGRVITPLLYIHIYTCEARMVKETLTAPNIAGRLKDFYKHEQDDQLQTIYVYLNNGRTLKALRSQAVEWIKRFPNSAVLVVLEGHTTVQTGELVYAFPGAKTNRHAHITEILRATMQDAYDPVFMQNPSIKGLIALCCGHTFHHEGSLQSWKSLVESNIFTWVIGFSAKVLSPIKVTSALPLFVELAFLQQEKNMQDVEEALHRSFDRVDILSHTPVLLIRAWKGSESESGGDISVTQFALSNEDCPWGLDPPACPTCGVGCFVTSSMLDKKGDWCRLSCGFCKSRVQKVRRPNFVQDCDKKHLRPYKYCILPFPVPPDAWAHAKWKEGGRKKVGETQST